MYGALVYGILPSLTNRICACPRILFHHDTRELISGCTKHCRLRLHVKHRFKILSAPPSVSRKVQVCQGRPNRHNAPGVERKQ